MFPVYTTPEKFDKAKDTGHFGVVFDEIKHSRANVSSVSAQVVNKIP